MATSGPIPPNPSELLMSQRNVDFIQELKEIYDFIIIDSPPVGLVADSYEIMKYSDANIYVVRHEYTEKYMMKLITEKYQNNEIEHLGLIYNDYNTRQGTDMVTATATVMATVILMKIKIIENRY